MCPLHVIQPGARETQWSLSPIQKMVPLFTDEGKTSTRMGVSDDIFWFMSSRLLWCGLHLRGKMMLWLTVAEKRRAYKEPPLKKKNAFLECIITSVLYSLGEDRVFGQFSLAQDNRVWFSWCCGTELCQDVKGIRWDWELLAAKGQGQQGLLHP